MDKEKVGIAQALPGAEIAPLAEDLRFDIAFLLIRSIDSDGVPQWGYRSTGSHNLEELLGVLVTQVELVKAKLIELWD